MDYSSLVPYAGISLIRFTHPQRRGLSLMALRQVKNSIDDNEFITMLSLVFNQKMITYPRG